MILNVYDNKDCTLNNKTAYFFNILKNTYNLPFEYEKYNYTSISFFIYGYLLNHIPSLSNINYDNNLNMVYPYREYYEIKKEYSFYIIDIPKYINDYIDIKIKDEVFFNKLKQNNNFKYNSKNKNTLLYILSSDEFNIGNIYNEYMKKLNNTLLQNKKEKINLDTHQKNKLIVYDIFFILEGLYKIMFNNDDYCNLGKYENTPFDTLLILVKKKYGNIYLSYKNIDYIYNSYINKQIKYYSIYRDIIDYPQLKDNITILFILQNFNNYNSRIKEMYNDKIYSKYIDKIFKSFIKEGEEPSDHESEHIPYSYSIDILNEIKNKCYDKLKKNDFIYDKIIKLNNTDNSIPFITDDTYDKLSIFIEKKKRQEKKILSKPVVKNIEKKEQNDTVQYSLFNNLVNNIIRKEDPKEDVNIINDSNILSPIYKTKFKVGDSFIFETLLQYIYFNEYYILYNIYTKNSDKSYLLSYNYLFKDTTTNILLFSDTISDEFKNINELEDSYYVLLDEIKLYLFNQSISYKKQNKYFKFVMFYLNNVKIQFNNNDKYLGLKEGKGDNLIGEYLSREHDNIIKYNKCPDNFYIILEILCYFDKDIINWINYKIEQLSNYIIIISKYNNISCIEQNHIKKLFRTLESILIVQEKDIYITPLLYSFKININKKINENKSKYNIQYNISLSEDSIKSIWTYINLLCNHFYKKKQVNYKLNYTIIDSVYEYVNNDKLDININTINKVINNVISIIDLNIIQEEEILSNNEKYTLVLNFIQGNTSNIKCSSINDIIKNVFNDNTLISVKDKYFSHIKYKLNILQK